MRVRRQRVRACLRGKGGISGVRGIGWVRYPDRKYAGTTTNYAWAVVHRIPGQWNLIVMQRVPCTTTKVARLTQTVSPLLVPPVSAPSTPPYPSPPSPSLAPSEPHTSVPPPSEPNSSPRSDSQTPYSHKSPDPKTSPQIQ
jgi:hypothetical protein